MTGVAYVKETGVLWVAAGTNTASHFEPKSGDNVRMNYPGITFAGSFDICFHPIDIKLFGSYYPFSVTPWKTSHRVSECIIELIQWYIPCVHISH